MKKIEGVTKIFTVRAISDLWTLGGASSDQRSTPLALSRSVSGRFRLTAGKVS